MENEAWQNMKSYLNTLIIKVSAYCEFAHDVVGDRTNIVLTEEQNMHSVELQQAIAYAAAEYVEAVKIYNASLGAKPISLN